MVRRENHLISGARPLLSDHLAGLALSIVAVRRQIRNTFRIFRTAEAAHAQALTRLVQDANLQLEPAASVSAGDDQFA
jgi:hypothetical protein